MSCWPAGESRYSTHCTTAFRMTGMIQQRRAETDRLAVKGLPRAGGEMDLSVVTSYGWIAQVDFIGQIQKGQRETLSRAEIEEQSRCSSLDEYGLFSCLTLTVANRYDCAGGRRGARWQVRSGDPAVHGRIGRWPPTIWDTY